MIHFLSVVFISIVVSFACAGSVREPQAVKEPIQSQLNMVLGFAGDLHEALFQRNSLKTEEAVDRLIDVVSKLEIQLSAMKMEISHLMQVMKSLRVDLKALKRASADSSEQSLRSVFGNVVQIARNYKLTQYRLFFCAKDQSVWLQRDRVAHNPFNPETFRNCGSAIR